MQRGRSKERRVAQAARLEALVVVQPVQELPREGRRQTAMEQTTQEAH